MPSDEDLLHAVDRLAEYNMAQADVFSDIICILAEKSNIERQRLAEEIDRLYAPVTSGEFYQTAYNNFRSRILTRVREKS